MSITIKIKLDDIKCHYCKKQAHSLTIEEKSIVSTCNDCFQERY